MKTKQTAAKGKTDNKKTTTKNKSNMKKETAKTGNPVIETATEDRLEMLSPSILVANPKNPRIKYEEIKELMLSIVENGLVNPITGYYKDGKVILKDGHRRKRAIDLAIEKGYKIKEVKVRIVEAPTELQETFDYILHNDGHPLTMLEQSIGVKRLLDLGCKLTDIAKRTGKAPGYIGNLIILTRIPMKVYNYIKEDKISAHAVLQIMIAEKEDAEKVISAVEKAIANAEKAGKQKATPKHIDEKESEEEDEDGEDSIGANESKQPKGKSFGAFYKWIEEIADFLAGRKDLLPERATVISDMLLAFENGQRAKEVAERYFLDKTKKELALSKAEPSKADANSATPPVKQALGKVEPAKSEAPKAKAALTKQTPAKPASKKAAAKKVAKKAVSNKK